MGAGAGSEHRLEQRLRRMATSCWIARSWSSSAWLVAWGFQ
jgi:hypothetical protein